MRQLFETFAAERRLECGKSQELIEELRTCLDNMRSATERDRYADYALFMENDHNFHRSIVASIGNKRLVQIYEELGVHIQVARAHYVQDVQGTREAQQEHEDIVRAFEEGDRIQVRDAITRHIENVLASLLASADENQV